MKLGTQTVVRWGIMPCSWSERKTFNLSPLSMLAVGFYYVEACFFHMQLTEVVFFFLIMKGCCICKSIERIIRCFTFICSINITYHIYWFLYVKPFLHPWDEFHLIMVWSLYVLLNLVCWYFVENLPWILTYCYCYCISCIVFLQLYIKLMLAT